MITQKFERSELHLSISEALSRQIPSIQEIFYYINEARNS